MYSREYSTIANSTHPRKKPADLTRDLSMTRIVMKFGGTSVANLERIRHVSRLVEAEVKAGHEVAVVVSAMSGETNRLVALVDELDADRIGNEDMHGGAIEENMIPSSRQASKSPLVCSLLRCAAAG